MPATGHGRDLAVCLPGPANAAGANGSELSDGRPARFFAQYARARDLGLDAIADELFDIADDGQNDWMERHGEGNEGYTVNGEHVSRSRLRVDTRKWYLSKLAPKRYGEKLEVTEKTELQDASDEQLHEAIRKRIASMKARGIDVEAMINGEEEAA